MKFEEELPGLNSKGFCYTKNHQKVLMATCIDKQKVKDGVEFMMNITAGCDTEVDIVLDQLLKEFGL